MRASPLSHLVAFIYSIGLLATAIGISWLLLSKINFLYPTFYQLLSIEQTISEFGPQNHYKQGFSSTTSAQHFEYFEQIVDGINHQGEGLSDISYPHQGVMVKLLREAEVIHLQDVANLIDSLTIVVGVGMFGALLSLGYFRYAEQKKPTIRRQLLSLLMLIVTVVVTGLMIGFIEVFYWLHQVIFPHEHQWFFYYQDSLMTTMMQAPTLFGPISALLITVSLFMFIGLNLLLSLADKRRVN